MSGTRGRTRRLQSTERDDISYRLPAHESFPDGVKRIDREQLDRAVDHLTSTGDRDEAVHEARKHIADGPVGRDGASVFRGGLRQVWKRGYGRLAAARDQPRVELLHEWRKRVKYPWYYVRILQPIWKDVLQALAGEIHDLADYLGDAHDLAVPRQPVIEEPEVCEDRREARRAVGLIEQRREELQAAAWPLGEGIYVETPDGLVARIVAYWDVWRDEEANKVERVCPQ